MLFQTILDIANNKEIQKIIQNFESRSDLEGFLQMPGVVLLMMKIKMGFSVFLQPLPVLTKKYLEYPYIIGVRLSKTLSGLTIHSILESFKISSQLVQKEISVIKKNDDFNKKLKLLTSLQCNCENDNTTRSWHFPVICTLLFPLFLWAFMSFVKWGEEWPLKVMGVIGFILDCFWYRNFWP